MSHNAESGFQIRPYLPADRDSCLTIFRSNVPRYFDSSELPEFENFLEKPDGDYFVVEIDGAVVACGGCYVRDGTGCLSWGMVSRENHRGSVGTKLLVWRVDLLFAQPEISEVAIDTSQHTAGFFARYGFRTRQQIKDGFGRDIDLISMSLQRMDWLRAG